MKIFTAWHIALYCIIAHFAMGSALANNLHKKPTRPVVLYKDGFALYDSKAAAGEVILKLYGGM